MNVGVEEVEEGARRATYSVTSAKGELWVRGTAMRDEVEAVKANDDDAPAAAPSSFRQQVPPASSPPAREPLAPPNY